MADEKISIGVGMVTGLLTKFITGDIVYTMVVAFFTGAAAYGGQLTVKYIQKKIKTNKADSKDVE